MMFCAKRPLNVKRSKFEAVTSSISFDFVHHDERDEIKAVFLNVASLSILLVIT